LVDRPLGDQHGAHEEGDDEDGVDGPDAHDEMILLAGPALQSPLMSAAASYPPLPSSVSDLAMPAFAVGHGSDRVGMTGVTVVLCPQGVTTAAEVRGSATATRQFDSLV